MFHDANFKSTLKPFDFLLLLLFYRNTMNIPKHIPDIFYSRNIFLIIKIIIKFIFKIYELGHMLKFA